MFYEALGGDQYKVSFKVYRDCDVSLNPYEDPAEVNIFDLTTSTPVNTTEFFDLVSVEDLNLISSTACDSAPNGSCYRLLTYEKVLTLPPTIGGYLISYTRCCRTGSITNLANGLNEGLTIFTSIPSITSGVTSNTSPIIGPEPEIFLCVNQPIDFDLSAIDPDGDSLVYELVDPYTGTYDPNLPPPYSSVNWAFGYDAQNPLGAMAQTNLNAETGLLSMTPNQQGMFQFGLKVSEYRNGVLIGTSIRDFFFIVRACLSLSYNADIEPQEFSSSFTDYCQGLTIDFGNYSDFGTYLWDFGVDGIQSDTSSQIEPIFTYPESGIYEVSLILNPGLQCADTATGQFIVYEKPDLTINSDSVQCFDNNSFDFEVLGSPNDSANYLWDFGPNASISNAMTTSVNGVQYAAAGSIPVFMYYNDNYCSDTLVDTILIVDASQINLAFTKPDELACAPYEVQFSNLSTSSDSIQYYWDFGNGFFSNSSDPNHVFDLPGTYDITLYGISNNGCGDTAEITYTNYVEVFPSPTAGIAANRQYVDAYDPIVEFYNQSVNYTSFEFHVEGQTASIDPYPHAFVNSGIQYPFIVAMNDFGCTDTASIQIEMSGEETIFIPTAVTPNGDGKNDQFKLNLLDLLNLEFRIFNRNGAIVFETNDPNGTWDCAYKGETVQDGVYVYQLKYTDLQKIPQELWGHLTVIK